MADAYYLQFFDNAERTHKAVMVDLRFYKPASNEKLILWERENDDLVCSNYRRIGESLVYDPPVYTPPVVPDADAMLTAIWDDPLWVAVPALRPYRPQLAFMIEPLKKYLLSGEYNRVREAWADIKLGLDPNVSALVEAKALIFNVPLTEGV